jgi:hypothetical protein
MREVTFKCDSQSYHYHKSMSVKDPAGWFNVQFFANGDVQIHKLSTYDEVCEAPQAKLFCDMDCVQEAIRAHYYPPAPKDKSEDLVGAKEDHAS